MQTLNIARKYGSKALVLAAATTASLGAFAQATNPIVTLIQGVDLSTVAAAVLAVAVIVVAIALTFKGPDVAKRVIRKV